MKRCALVQPRSGCSQKKGKQLLFALKILKFYLSIANFVQKFQKVLYKVLDDWT